MAGILLTVFCGHVQAFTDGSEIPVDPEKGDASVCVEWLRRRLRVYIVRSNMFIHRGPRIRWCHLSTILGSTPHCFVSTEGNVTFSVTSLIHT